MQVLVACEVSGRVRDAFIERGHDAYSCDLLPAQGKYPEKHIQANAIQVAHCRKWDLMIAHPECTYLSSSGLHWNQRTPGRCVQTRDAIIFAEILWKADIDKICIENPVGCLPTHSNLMKYTQIIQPYEFCEDASKATCLWLKNLPDLRPTGYFAPRITKDGKKRWGNQTDSGQNKLAPSETRAAERSITYLGIADAMAEQWGAY